MYYIYYNYYYYNIYLFKLCLGNAGLGMCVKVRGQLAAIASLLPPCESQGLKSGHQV